MYAGWMGNALCIKSMQLGSLKAKESSTFEHTTVIIRSSQFSFEIRIHILGTQIEKTDL